MSAIPVIQPSFAAGELEPLLYGPRRSRQVPCRRADDAQPPRPCPWRRVGTGQARALRRRGLDESSARHRLIPFQFRTLPSSARPTCWCSATPTMQVAMQSGAESGGARGFVTESRQGRSAGLSPCQSRCGSRLTGHGFSIWRPPASFRPSPGMILLNGRTVTSNRHRRQPFPRSASTPSASIRGFPAPARRRACSACRHRMPPTICRC